MRKMQSQRGFTLLEMLVSLGIFTVVAVIAVGALVRIVGLNRQAQTLQSSMNNLSFALEAMSREMRVAGTYHCETNPEWNYDPRVSLTAKSCEIGTGGALIAFESSRAGQGGACRLVYAYRLSPNGSGRFLLEKAQQSACSDILDTASYSSILDDANITVTGYQLGIYTEAKKNSWAFIRMAGYAGTREKDKNFFDVQTSISERIVTN